MNEKGKVTKAGVTGRFMEIAKRPGVRRGGEGDEAKWTG